MYKLKKNILISILMGSMLLIGLLSQGQNAKLNDITFATNHPYLSAGADASICNNRDFITGGVFSSCAITMWQSSGDGTFENSNDLITVYTPGVQDIINGIVTLKLIIFPLGGGGNELIYDEMVLYLDVCTANNKL